MHTYYGSVQAAVIIELPSISYIPILKNELYDSVYTYAALYLYMQQRMIIEISIRIFTEVVIFIFPSANCGVTFEYSRHIIRYETVTKR